MRVKIRLLPNQQPTCIIIRLTISDSTFACRYETSGQFIKLIELYLRLKQPEAFELIEKYQLFDFVKDQAKDLLMMDAPLQSLNITDLSHQERFEMFERWRRGPAAQLLARNINRIPIDSILAQIDDQRVLMHVYLDVLFEYDPNAASRYHDLQV